MPDIFSAPKRSAIMAAVRSVGNKATELCLVEIFRSNGIKGWRRHLNMRGKPDFTFRQHKLAIFVDGCFWHGCPTHLRMPVSNKDYWAQKIQRNVRRDKTTTRELRRSGWRVLRVWEHELRKPSTVVRRVSRMLRMPERSITTSGNKYANARK
jgi:DNA mismatch endonuclease (patch repair protein)